MMSNVSDELPDGNSPSTVFNSRSTPIPAYGCERFNIHACLPDSELV